MRVLRHKYTVHFTANLGKFFPKLEEFTDNVNKFMGEMGFKEKMIVRGRPFSLSVTTGKKLSHEEQAKLAEISIESFRKNLPEYELQLDGIEYLGTAEIEELEPVGVFHEKRSK